MYKSKMIYQRPTEHWIVRPAQILCAVAFFIVTYQSLRPAQVSLDITHFDKIMHSGAYAVLTGLLALSLPKVRLVQIFLMTTLYGGAIEIIQALMPYGRTGSMADHGANMLGGVIAICVWIVFIRVQNHVRYK